jgi:outer membrane protein assembly factor BamB
MVMPQPALRAAFLLVVGLASPAGAEPGAASGWLTFGFDAQRSGVNPHETAISPSSVARLRRLWTAGLPEPADAPPILLRGVPTSGSTRDALYLVTRAGALIALDAATGMQLWEAHTSGPSKLTTSSPVADPSGEFVYSYGLDGRVHRWQASSGAEAQGGGWPVAVTLMPESEKGSSALNLAGGRLYAVTSGYLGDAPPYQGHVAAIELASAAVHVWNSLCSAKAHLLSAQECPEQRSGIWARAGVTIEPASGRLFLATGNGPFTGGGAAPSWGDSVIVLSPDATQLLDSYTPTDFSRLEREDTDLGSTAPALLPPIAASRTPDLAVQGGKDKLLRLLNRRDLSSQRGPGHVGGELQLLPTPGSCLLLTQPAVWTDDASAVWLLVTDGCGTAGYQVTTSASGVTRLRERWRAKGGGTTPVVAGGVLFMARSDELLALEPRSGRQLWTSRSPEAGGTMGKIHWQSPIVVDGRVFISDEAAHVTAYGLPAAKP